MVGDWVHGSPTRRRFFRWDATNGMQIVVGLLANDGIDLVGWESWVTTGVSSDGSIIVGWGRNPDGVLEGWVAYVPLPEPGGYSGVANAEASAYGGQSLTASGSFNALALFSFQQLW